ncbi:MAG: hypothetical protein AAGH89_14860, partial [Verrucomicrobiota bacterium]
KSQLSSGRVCLSVAQLMQYADQASRRVLAGASPDVQVTLPLKEIFRQLPADVLNPTKPEEPSEPQALETPFSEGAREDAETTVSEVISQTPVEEPAPEPEAVVEEDESAAMMKAFLQTKELPETPAAPVNEAIEPPAPPVAEVEPPTEPEVGAFPADMIETESAAESEVVDEAEVGELDDLGAPVEIASEAAPAVAEEEGSPDEGYGDMITEDLEKETVEAATTIEAESTESVIEPEPEEEPEVESVVEEPEPAEEVAPEPVVATPEPVAAPKQFMGFGGLDFQGPLRDLELRAVFGTEDQFSPQRVTELTSEFSGIEGSVLFDREGRVFGEKMPQERAGDSLPETMCRVFDRVTGLAADLGFETSEAFTIHTSHGVISFYSEGDLCLSVLHETTDLPAGMSEKLVLTLRGVKRLVESGTGS